MFSNKDLKRLVIPLFLDQILLIIVGIAGTMMVSYAGESAMSGVSLVEMINMLLINVLSALATGGSVIVSQYIGSKDINKARFASSQLITITAIISLLITLLVILFHEPILKILFGKIDESVMNSAITYFIISSLSYPFLAIYNACTALFRSMGNSRIPVIISVIMNGINLFGDAIGIFYLHAGVKGVAIATLIARLIGAVIMLMLTLNQKNMIYIKISEIFSWDNNMIRRILNLAVPNGIENGLVQLGRVLLVSITALFGTTQIAANGITNSLVLIAISVANSMNLAIVTVVGQCIGARDYEQATYYIKKLLKVTYISTFIISIGEILLLNQILNLYTLSSATHKLTFILVVIHNIFAITLYPLGFTLSSALRATGDVKFTMVVSLITMFVFRLFFAYILGVVFKMGVIGVWTAMGIDWFVRAVIYVFRFKNGKWKELKVI